MGGSHQSEWTVYWGAWRKSAVSGNRLKEKTVKRIIVVNFTQTHHSYRIDGDAQIFNVAGQLRLRFYFFFIKSWSKIEEIDTLLRIQHSTACFLSTKISNWNKERLLKQQTDTPKQAGTSPRPCSKAVMMSHWRKNMNPLLLGACCRVPSKNVFGRHCSSEPVSSAWCGYFCYLDTISRANSILGYARL